MNDIDNPLASHPLLQKRLDVDGDEICGPLPQRDIEAKPVIAEAMADAMAKPLVSADFGAVEARVLAVGPSSEQLAVAQAEIEKVSPPSTFVVPASMTDKEIQEITARIAEKTKLPFNVVRGEAERVVKQQATFAAQAAWDHTARNRERFAEQLAVALRVIETAGRPVKLGFIEHEIGGPIFRTLEPELNRHPSVKRKTHKNQIYYTWKA